MENEIQLKNKIQKFLSKEIISFELKGKGAVNFAYQVETSEGKYIVKQEREDKELQPQNSLIVEAAVARQLYEINLNIPVPHVVFVIEKPDIYGYEYIEGDLMRNVWKFLNEEEKISICQKLGRFHAEIGKKITLDMAKQLGVKIDDSTEPHPEALIEYKEILSSADVPEALKELAEKAKTILDQTTDKFVFQFIHNDAHHENVLIKGKQISGIIDFGNAEYGEVSKEFSRYIRDFPDYFQYIVSSYEEASGNKLSYERLVTNGLILGLMEIVEDYRKGGEDKKKAVEVIRKYKELIEKIGK